MPAVMSDGLNGYHGLVYAPIQDTVLPAQRASTMAICLCEMHISGAWLSPALTGSRTIGTDMARRTGRVA